jgi:hypothetical protein
VQAAPVRAELSLALPVVRLKLLDPLLQFQNHRF